MAEDELKKAVEKIDEDLDTIITLKEKIETVFSKSSEADKKDEKRIQTDMAKIQIFSDSCHAKVTSLIGFMVAFFIGLSAIFYGVLYQAINATSVSSVLISVDTWKWGMIATVIGTFIIAGVTFVVYSNDVKTMSGLIEDVKAGKELPPLVKIRQKPKPEKQ